MHILQASYSLLSGGLSSYALVLHGVCACNACIRTSRSSPDAAYTLLYTFDSGISLHFFGATNRTLRTVACLTHLADALVPRSGACSTLPASIRVKTM